MDSVLTLIFMKIFQKIILSLYTISHGNTTLTGLNNNHRSVKEETKKPSYYEYTRDFSYFHYVSFQHTGAPST